MEYVAISEAHKYITKRRAFSAKIYLALLVCGMKFYKCPKVLYVRLDRNHILWDMSLYSIFILRRDAIVCNVSTCDLTRRASIIRFKVFQALLVFKYGIKVLPCILDICNYWINWIYWFSVFAFTPRFFFLFLSNQFFHYLHDYLSIMDSQIRLAQCSYANV
jgi:hypothetical protein